jgi:hypothetical protein
MDSKAGTSDKSYASSDISAFSVLSIKIIYA